MNSKPPIERSHEVALVDLARRFGGAETRVLQLMTELHRDGFTPTLVCLHGSPLAAKAKELGVEPVFLHHGRLSLGTIMEFISIARGRRWKVIDSHNTQSHIVAMLGAVISRASHVMTIHSTYSDSEPRMLGVDLHSFVMRLSSLGAKALIPVSHSVAQSLSSAARRKAADPIYSGVCESQESVGGSFDRVRERHGLDRRKVVVIVGRLVPAKDLRLALEVVQRAGQQTPEGFQVLIVGDGPLKQSLRSHAEELKLLDVDSPVTVTFVGHRSDVADYYEAADVLLMTSSTEGLPFTALEAAKASLPMVSTDVGSMSHVFGPAGSLLVKRISDTHALVNALADSVVTLLEDDTLRKELGQRAQERVTAHYTVRQTSQKTSVVYRSCSA